GEKRIATNALTPASILRHPGIEPIRKARSASGAVGATRRSAYLTCARSQLIVKLTFVEWLKLPLLPIMVSPNVPVEAVLLGEIVKVDPSGVVTGLALKLALVFLGNPLTLSVTELDLPLTVPSVTL